MKIVVLAGGTSTEREISIVSGTGICGALRQKGHEAILVDIFCGVENVDWENPFPAEYDVEKAAEYMSSFNPQIKEMEKKRRSFFGPNVLELCEKCDIVFLGLHGANGEDGKVQATFDLLGIRYTGTGYLSSAMAMDKRITKEVFLMNHVPTPGGFTMTRDNLEKDIAKHGLEFPVVVKTSCGGSSVGVYIVNDQKEYEEALTDACQYGADIVVEEYIKGREFSVGVIAGKSLPIIEIIPKTGWYDYKTKYQSGMANDVCPAELSEELTKKMQEYAVAVYHILKLEVYARIDFLLDANDNMYCLEANTLPGMTPTSLLPQEAKAVGVEYGELCEQIIGIALKKYEGKKKTINKSGQYSQSDMLPVWTSPMQKMTLEKIAKVCHGRYFGNESAKSEEISMVTIDSRTVERNSLFVAIKGERVDGNTFVAGAYADGALCCMSEEEPEDKTRPYIVVDSCYQALKDMAELYRTLCPVKVVGITGSVGKTTTKEMIASVLSQHFHVLKTKGNFNNEVGVPLTLFRLRKEHEIAIVEMGISDFGEMTRLTKMVQPDSCVITNIGQCHLENLHDRDGVLKAKTEIFTHMNPNGHIYLNGDDDKLITVQSDGKRQITFFGNGKDNCVRAEKVENLGLKGTKMMVVTPDEQFEVTVPVPGKHMVLNALAAIAIGLDMGMTTEEIAKGIRAFRPVGGHSSIEETAHFMLIDDCYNANPVSMKAGIDVLSDASGRKVAILGDMFELGTKERKMHYEVGEYAVQKGIDLFICVGSLAKEIANALEKAGKETSVFYFAQKEEAMEMLPSLVKEGDTILVKASHGMHFEKIVAMLKEM